MSAFRDHLTAALAVRDEPSVVDEETSWSGRELLARSMGLAHRCAELGVAAGCPVVALVDASPAALALTVGGVLGARPIAPVNPRSSSAEIEAVVRSLGATLLVVDPAYAVVAAEVVRAVGGLQVEVLSPEPRSASGAMPSASGDVEIVLHTSGTTGRPKAVALTDGVMSARVRAYAEAVDLRSGDRYASPSPFHHIAGVGAQLVALAVGASVVPMPRFDVGRWRAVRALRPSHVLLVPTMIEMLLAEGELQGEMRALIYGASPIHPDTLTAVVRTLGDTRLVQLFGQTEGSPLTRLVHEDHVAALAGDAALLGSVGRPVRGVELRLEQVDEDGVGEIVVRAEHLGRVDPDGWLRTGDVAEIRDGYVFLRGRRGDMIIRGGENVHPLEVERALASHPGVAEVAVVGRPDRRLGEVPWAFVVACAEEPAAAELAAFARARLAGFKVPVGWTYVDALPRNAAGKVVRRDLPIN